MRFRFAFQRLWDVIVTAGSYLRLPDVTVSWFLINIPIAASLATFDARTKVFQITPDIVDLLLFVGGSLYIVPFATAITRRILLGRPADSIRQFLSVGRAEALYLLYSIGYLAVSVGMVAAYFLLFTVDNALANTLLIFLLLLLLFAALWALFATTACAIRVPKPARNVMKALCSEKLAIVIFAAAFIAYLGVVQFIATFTTTALISAFAANAIVAIGGLFAIHIKLVLPWGYMVVLQIAAFKVFMPDLIKLARTSADLFVTGPD